ncbi:RDD family protein [Allohahella sp. A8]|uniref:RDD family protein n=1 Tax=Allohahella sp. A8 TaxID=3141461 RepID=UPI000C093004|nr:RDD family protein [Hahellaceae bacterium]
MTEKVERDWVSSFWRRTGALIIDTLVLGAFGFILGLYFEGYFVQIGGWGRLVGFSIALVYFGILNSSISGGQTVGKKIFDIKVVNVKNNSISLSRSVVRYLILATPFALNGARLPDEITFSLVFYIISMIVFGGALSILYLYIFNRTTRQSLHDLFVGTYVVHANVEKQEPGKVWNVHLIVVGLLLLAAAVTPALTSQLVESEPFKGMLPVQSAISNDPAVSYATLFVGSSTFSATNNDPKTTSYIRSQAFLKSDDVSDSDLARRLAAIIVANYPQALQKDMIQINLTYGYDIGITSSWSSNAYNFNPLELKGTE